MTALSVVQKFFPNVTTVQDAIEPLEVEVKTCDIQRSKTKNHRGCVFARACKRTYGIEGAVIAVKTAYLIDGTTALRYAIPESLSREIVSFDRNGQFAPGDYHIDSPAYKLKRPKPISSGSRGTKKKRSSGKANYHATKSIRNLHNPKE
jgi:hypothetical protein